MNKISFHDNSPLHTHTHTLVLIEFWRRPQVLITKLRSANTLETRQYRKASKALLVLIPLLGITYLIVIYGPEEGGVGSHIFAVTRAILLSTQVRGEVKVFILLEKE